MIQRLFIYGTLVPGGPNEHVLSEIGGSWEAATVTGILREEGWGAEMGYPGIVLDEQGIEIQGFLFSSEKLSDHWARLDEFEGNPNVAKVGGLQSLGVKGEAVIGYRDRLTTRDLKSSSFPGR